MAEAPEDGVVSPEEDPPDPPDTSSLSQAKLYSILADPRRRNLVHYLKQSDEPKGVGELAEQLAAWENDKNPSEITSQERKRVYISLYQSHLPTLHKAGVINYDADGGLVTLSDDLSRRRIFVEIVPRNDIPWSVYYLGLSLVGVVILALAWLDVYPFRVVPDLVWGVVIIVFFAGSAITQTVLSRRRELGDPGPPPDLDA